MSEALRPTDFAAVPLPGESPPYHASSVAEVLAGLGVVDDRGLEASEVERRRARFGANELPRAKPPSSARRFLGQFLDPVIGVLIFAALVSGLSGDMIDTAAILAIVLLNGTIGFVQEERAERALASLQRLSTPQAKVVREGRTQSIPARDLVPGDRILIEGGDHVPADARLLRAYDLRVQESALTGESISATKDADVVLDPATIPADRINMVYQGTDVVAGKADAAVVATGTSTELGRIAGLLEHTRRDPTPLQRRLSELGRVLAIVVVGAAALIFAIHLLRGGPALPSFLLAVSLAVAAVPEGLPAVVTLVLAIGLRRLARRNALIRRLPSVETLGAVTVICSDKTGTLTRNEMTVREIVTANAHYDIGGTGYDRQGSFHLRSEGETRENAEPIDPRAWPDLMRALQIAAWCNTARVTEHPESPGVPRIVGDPTEGALIIVASKADVEATERDDRMIHEIPFDSERRAMSVVVLGPEDSATMYTKGAPEAVVSRCDREWRDGRIEPLTSKRRDEIHRTVEEMASRALRVLALADRHHPDARHEAVRREEELVFVGLVGMIDPPRPEAISAIRKCRSAGIRPVMITGDHPAAAWAVARAMDLVSEHDRMLIGADLERMSDEDLIDVVDSVGVYARVTAEHKSRVVRAWKARGEVVAMTGDGVNDTPAMRAADIAVAMGRVGTDITREASDMVLLDDNFASIVNAVEEGRGIHDNIRKVIHYLSASNVSEVLLMLCAAVVGWPAPLTAVQLLWLNLVSDGLPALALGVEPLESDIMSRPPRSPDEPVITRRHGRRILTHGVLMGLVAMSTFGVAFARGGNLERARAAVFCALAFTQLFFALSCRDRRRMRGGAELLANPHLFGAIVLSTLLQVGIVSFAPTRLIFDIPAHPGTDWLFILPLALTPLVVIELWKPPRGRRGRPGTKHP